MKPFRRILIIRLSALGDICMTLPVIESVCRNHPEVEFTLLTSKVGTIVAQSVLSLPNLMVRAFDKNRYSGLLGLNRLYNELKRLEFDAVVDLHDVLRTKWVSLRFRLSGIPVMRIDKGRNDKKALVNHHITESLMSGVERYHQVFEKLGLHADIDYDAALHGKDLLLQGESWETAIGIAPFAQHKGKIYPLKKMGEVIDLLVQRMPHLRIYLFGSKDEQAQLDKWVNAHPENVVNLAGRQSIAEDLHRMARLQLMVSMDSANMHLASLVGLRCVSIWGATHRYSGFLGFGQNPDDCIELPLPCRPCSIYGNKPCSRGDWACMNDISPEVVAKRIEEIICEKA